MVEDNNTEVVQNTTKKIYGFNIASLVLGIVSIVLWCFWFLSIPCSILAVIFGILGVKKEGKAMGITGIVTGAISFAIWVVIFFGAFMYGFMEGLTEDSAYSYRTSTYWN